MDKVLKIISIIACVILIEFIVYNSGYIKGYIDGAQFATSDSEEIGVE